MRVAMLGVAAVVAAPIVGGAWLVPAPVQATQAAEIVAKVREALGGEQRLAGVTALVAEGPFRRAMGPRQMEGTIALTLGIPDRIRHEEELTLPNGAAFARLAGMNGEHAWEDTANRGGGMGGGIMIRMGPPPGADGREPDPEARRQFAQRRLAGLYQRFLLALLAAGTDLSYAGVAEVAEGRAHVLETKDATGRPVRLLVDQQTHLPIGLTFMEVRPRMMFAGPGGPGGAGGRGAARGGPPPDVEEIRRRMQEEGPPPPSTVIMRLEEYKAVSGIKLPHLIVQVVDGEPVEEWTIKKYEINPRLKADVFDRK